MDNRLSLVTAEFCGLPPRVNPGLVSLSISLSLLSIPPVFLLSCLSHFLSSFYALLIYFFIIILPLTYVYTFYLFSLSSSSLIYFHCLSLPPCLRLFPGSFYFTIYLFLSLLIMYALFPYLLSPYLPLSLIPCLSLPLVLWLNFYIFFSMLLPLFFASLS